MKILPVQQQSVEWLLARSGIPTASQFDQLITPKWEQRTGEMPRTYLAAKLAEYWQGGPLASFNSFDMEQGSILENEAIPWYELEYGEQVDRVGFCTTDDGLIGCSPDGLIGDDGGIEIKCPSVTTHVKYLMAGVLPPEYAAQVHGSMFVTGRSWWRFLSYCRHFPPFMLHVQRDVEIQEAIGGALYDFLARFQQAKEKLIALNGGRPPRNRKPEPELETVSANHDPDDIIP